MGQIAVPSSGGSGTINITTNGSHDVKKYATANVNVSPIRHVVYIGSCNSNSSQTFYMSNYVSSSIYTTLDAYNFVMKNVDVVLNAGGGNVNTAFSYNPSTGVVTTQRTVREITHSDGTKKNGRITYDLYCVYYT